MERLTEFKPDLIMADVNMPGLTGYEICQIIKQNDDTRQIPVILLVGSFEPFDEAEAARVGADDYLTKPFDHLELMARLRSLIRRSHLTQMSLSADVVAGELAINFANRSVWVASQEVRLTATEYRLLEELVRHAGAVLSAQVLLERVWGYEADPQGNVVELYIHYLRRKLDPAGSPASSSIIRTVRGVGYQMRPS